MCYHLSNGFYTLTEPFYKRQFENSYDLPKEAPVDLYFLDLLSYRDISNEIAKRFNVRHESPQLILLQQKKVVHHSSHQDIDVENLKEFL